MGCAPPPLPILVSQKATLCFGDGTVLSSSWAVMSGPHCGGGGGGEAGSECSGAGNSACLLDSPSLGTNVTAAGALQFYAPQCWREGKNRSGEILEEKSSSLAPLTKTTHPAKHAMRFPLVCQYLLLQTHPSSVSAGIAQF